jgi:hypothetical protein
MASSAIWRSVFGALSLVKTPAPFVHAHEPLRRGAVDHRALVAPAVRVAVGDGLVAISRPASRSVSMICGTAFQMFWPPNSGKSAA